MVLFLDRRLDRVRPAKTERHYNRPQIVRAPGDQTRNAWTANGLRDFLDFRENHQVHGFEQTDDRYVFERGQGKKNYIILNITQPL